MRERPGVALPLVFKVVALILNLNSTGVRSTHRRECSGDGNA